MKDFLAVVTQLSLNNSPISLSEMREITLRHLLSDPSDLNKRSMTRALLTACLSMLMNEYPRWKFKPTDDSPILNPGAYGVETIPEYFLRYYNEGLLYAAEEEGYMVAKITDVWEVWPKTLPPDMDYYPKDIIAQFAAVMGYQAGRGQQSVQTA